MARDFDRLVTRYQHVEVPLHESYTKWLLNQCGRPDSPFEHVEYDPVKYPDQALSHPISPAHDRHPRLPDFLYYRAMRRRLGQSLGHLATSDMLGQLRYWPASSDDPTRLPVAMIKAQERSENTIIITPHFKLAELGYLKYLRFLAKKDRPRMPQNGALMNKLMTRQKIKGGKRLVDAFTPIGDVIYSSPKSASADQFGIPLAAHNGINALCKYVLRDKLEMGGYELDAALTGSELKEVRDEDEVLQGYMFPVIDPASAKLIEEFDNLLTATMIKSPLTGHWTMFVGKFRPVSEALQESGSAEALVDDVFSEFKTIIECNTRYETQYTKIAEAGDRLATK